jgi:hypothetical protein
MLANLVPALAFRDGLATPAQNDLTYHEARVTLVLEN